MTMRGDLEPTLQNAEAQPAARGVFDRWLRAGRIDGSEHCFDTSTLPTSSRTIAAPGIPVIHVPYKNSNRSETPPIVICNIPMPHELTPSGPEFISGDHTELPIFNTGSHCRRDGPHRCFCANINGGLVPMAQQTSGSYSRLPPVSNLAAPPRWRHYHPFGSDRGRRQP